MSVPQKLKEIVAEQLGVDEATVTENASFVGDLGADSLDQIEVVLAIEEELEIDIPDEDVERISTVGQMVEYLQGRGVSLE